MDRAGLGSFGEARGNAGLADSRFAGDQAQTTATASRRVQRREQRRQLGNASDENTPGVASGNLGIR